MNGIRVSVGHPKAQLFLVERFHISWSELATVVARLARAIRANGNNQLTTGIDRSFCEDEGRNEGPRRVDLPSERNTPRADFPTDGYTK